MIESRALYWERDTDTVPTSHCKIKPGPCLLSVQIYQFCMDNQQPR